MLKIDNSLLQDVGLGALPDAEKNSFLKHIYETLEMRVGIRLADQMSNQQLDEFEQYFEAKDDAGAFKWLETNFPNYKDIVQEEFDKLKSEVAGSAPQILAASQAAATQPNAVNQTQVPQAQQSQAAAVVPAVDPNDPLGVSPQAAPAPAQPYAAPPEAQPMQPPAPQQPLYPPQAPQAPSYQPAAPSYQPPQAPSQPQYPQQQPPAGPQQQ
jgi:hypothetical protein